MFMQHAEAEDVRETQSMQQRIRYYGCDTRDAKGDQMDKKPHGIRTASVAAVGKRTIEDVTRKVWHYHQA